MSAERACFNRRELRLSLGSRTSRRLGTKNGDKKPPRERLGRKIMKIRQTCDCDIHQRMREDRNNG